MYRMSAPNIQPNEGPPFIGSKFKIKAYEILISFSHWHKHFVITSYSIRYCHPFPKLLMFPPKKVICSFYRQYMTRKKNNNKYIDAYNLQHLAENEKWNRYEIYNDCYFSSLKVRKYINCISVLLPHCIYHT